jgi:tetratricopeptide (TPR) repeat protein
MSADHQSWLERLDMEQDNLRLALDNGLSAQIYEDTLQFAGTLFWFWQTLGYISEGRSYLEKIIAAASPDHPGLNAALAKALWCAGGLAWIQGDYDQANSQLMESISLWRQLGVMHKPRLAISLREAGIVATHRGELDEAFSALKESIQLLQEVGGKWDLALALYNHGLAYEVQGDIPIARAKFEESLSCFRELNEPWGLSVALNGLGRIAGRQGDYDNARPYLEEALSLSRALGDLWSSAASLYLLGEVLFRQKDMEPAKDSFAESLKLNQTVGDKLMIGFALHHVGRIASHHGNTKRAICLFGAAKSLRGDMSDTTSWSLTNHVECEQDIAELRANVEKTSFEQAWKEGQAMSVDEAIDFALSSSVD